MDRVLVVEDSADMAAALLSNLELEGYDARWCADGPGGLAEARQWKPDMIVLDLTLPGMDGYRVLRQLREDGLQMPVMILSSRDEEVDKVRGFRLGADDYVTKPFGLMELLARIEALLRRSRGACPDPEKAAPGFGDVVVDLRIRSVCKGGRPVELTPRAFDLLIALLEGGGAIVSRMSLLTRVWGYRSAVLTRTVDVHVAELRRKLEDDAANPRYILTVRKSGYRIAA
jgi:two-component system alkaline phosphatase synthesis response regulator PhoP